MTSVVKNFEKTSVGGQNLGKTSIVGEEIKKNHQIRLKISQKVKHKK